MSKNENQKYCQIRLSFNLNRKEDIQVYEELVKDKQKPSQDIIKMLYSQINGGNEINQRLKKIEELILNIENVKISDVKVVKDEANVTFDFDSIELDGLDFL